MKLEDVIKMHCKKIGYKWWVLFFTAVICISVFWYVFIPLIDYMFINTKSSTILRDSLAKTNMIPKDYSI